MFAAHISPSLPGMPEVVNELPDGRSSILFAVLAGVALALTTGGAKPSAGDQLTRQRVRIAIRAVLVFVMGALLTAVGTPLAIILPYYAVLFVLVLPLLRLRARTLFVIAAASSVAGPVLLTAVSRWGIASGAFGAFEAVDPVRRVSGLGVAQLLFTGYYPVTTWFAFIVAGLAVGRLDLGSLRRGMLALPGLALAVLASLSSALLLAAGSGGGALATTERLSGTTVPSWSGLLSAAPHSETPFEIIGGVGVALVIIDLALLAAARWPRALWPLTAIGVMSLTIYSVQALALDVLRTPLNGTAPLWYLAAFIVAASAVAMVWLHFFRRGPLEALIHEVSTRLSGTARGSRGAGRPRMMSGAPQ